MIAVFVFIVAALAGLVALLFPHATQRLIDQGDAAIWRRVHRWRDRRLKPAPSSPWAFAQAVGNHAVRQRPSISLPVTGPSVSAAERAQFVERRRRLKLVRNGEQG